MEGVWSVGGRCERDSSLPVGGEDVTGATLCCSEGVSERATGGLNGNVTSWLAQPRARPISLGNKTGGKSQQTFRGKIYCPGYLGLTSEQYRTDSDTAGLLTSLNNGSSPVKNLKMFINLANTNQGVTTALVYATMKITYHCEVFDRTELIAALNTTDGDDPDGGEEPTE